MVEGDPLGSGAMGSEERRRRYGFTPRPGLGLIYWVMLLPPVYAAAALSWPGETFAAPAYRLMRELGTEQTWAVIAASVAGFAAVAWGSRDVRLVHLALFLLGSWQTAVALMMFLSYPIGMFPGFVIGMAVLTCILAFRI